MRSWIYYLFVPILLAGPARQAYAEQEMDKTSAGQQFEQANAAYRASRFDEAISGYVALMEAGYSSEELLYNLGNSYFKQEALGKAILYYEKALILDSDDEDTWHNLHMARSLTKNEITTLPPFFLARWWAGIRQMLQSTAWSILGLLLFWLGVGGLMYWLLAAERSRKKLGFVVGICGLLLCTLPFALAFSRAQLEKDSRMAIVLDETVPLRSAPDPESTTLLQIYEGLKVELLDEIGNWSKVRLMNGEQGWLPMDSFEKV